jgi:hypothetical protein
MDAKSIQRLRDIGKKAGDDPGKMNTLARTQANLITDKDKAFNRFECSVFFYGPFSQVTLRFLDRAIELNYYGASDIKKNIMTILNHERAKKEITDLMFGIGIRGENFDPEYKRLEFIDV